MKYLCLDFGGTGVKYAIIDENFQLYDVNKENKIFQSHDEMITWVVDLFKTIHMKLSGIAISYCGEMNPFTVAKYIWIDWRCRLFNEKL